MGDSIVIKTGGPKKTPEVFSEIILRAEDDQGNSNEIKMISTGEFFINGKLIETDKEVFNNFKKFCAKATGN